MTKHVTLFGRKMRKDGNHLRLTFRGALFGIHPGYHTHDDRPTWFATGPGAVTNRHESQHAAARALERKIVAAHRRLGKLMGGKK